MATVKRGKRTPIEPKGIPPPIPPLTEEERSASSRAQYTMKPKLDALFASVVGQLASPIVLTDEDIEAEERKSRVPTARGVPSVGYVCEEHGTPLDPWGRCHAQCRTCQMDAPFAVIWIRGLVWQRVMREGKTVALHRPVSDLRDSDRQRHERQERDRHLGTHVGRARLVRS